MIAPNQLILVPPGIANFDPGLHRVVFASPREKAVALFWIGKSEEDGSVKPFTHCKKPRLHAWDAVAHLIEKGLFLPAPEIQVEEPTHKNRMAAIDRRRYKINSDILQSLVNPDMLTTMLCHGQWSKHVKATAAKHQIDVTTVLRLIARFFTLRMNLDWASEDRYWVKGKTRTVTRKLGRRADRVKSGHRLSAIGRNTTDNDKEAIKVFYDSLENHTMTKSAMYRDFETKFRPKKIWTSTDEGFNLIDDTSFAFISERQFRYALQNEIGQLKLLKAAVGERRLQLSHRPAIGTARDRVPYPGHTYIVDATVGDIYLVSAFDRRRLIGRPVIYLVVDAFSSLIVGVHVALEGPNLNQARVALYRAISDKTAWLAWLGLSDLAHLLPQGCAPTFWLADRGELHSKGSYAIQTELRTNLSIAAAYRAEWKALVERVFGILNCTIHWEPGAVAERIRERGTRDYRLDAVLTLKEFTRMLVRRIAILNLTRDMSDHLSAALITHNVTPNPIGFWNYGITYKHGSAVFLEHQSATLKTLLQKDALLTRHGVAFEQSQYTAPWMLEHPAVQLAGFGHQLPIKIIESPDDTTAAWCLLPNETSMREVRLQRQAPNSKLFCSEDFREMRTLAMFLGQDLADDTTDERISIQRASALDIDKARAETAAANRESPLSNREKTKGIRSNRKSEVESRGRNEVSTSRAEPVNLPTATTPMALPTPEMGTDKQDYFDRMSEQLNSWGAS